MSEITKDNDHLRRIINSLIDELSVEEEYLRKSFSIGDMLRREADWRYYRSLVSFLNSAVGFKESQRKFIRGEVPEKDWGNYELPNELY